MVTKEEHKLLYLIKSFFLKINLFSCYFLSSSNWQRILQTASNIGAYRQP